MMGARFAVAQTLEGGVLDARSRPAGGPPELGLDEVMRLAEGQGLRGRGGAGFPAARKLAAVASHRRRPIVVVNAAEGEPASGKDAALLRLSPEIVLDGAEIVARALGAHAIKVWAPAHDRGAVSAVSAAAEARTRRRLSVAVVVAPDRFVAGESSAAARGLSGEPALPRTDRRRTARSGVDGRPTLVLNAETLAQLARMAYGRPATRLVTVSGAVHTPGVVELADQAPLEVALSAAGGVTEPLRGLLLGGYHGRWLAPEPAAETILGDPAGIAPDCSIVVALPDRACLLAELDAASLFLAGESARQCGPCAFGLPELAASVRQIRQGRALSVDGEVDRHTDLLLGRGACHHPDGSVRFVASALELLAGEVQEHLAGHGSCGRPYRAVLPIPASSVATMLPLVGAGWSA